MSESTKWEVWTDMFGGYASRNAKYKTRELADAALARIVWHNRGNFYVREVPAAPLAVQGETNG